MGLCCLLVKIQMTRGKKSLLFPFIAYSVALLLAWIMYYSVMNKRNVLCCFKIFIRVEKSSLKYRLVGLLLANNFKGKKKKKNILFDDPAINLMYFNLTNDHWHRLFIEKSLFL